MYNRLCASCDFCMSLTLQTEVGILYTENSVKDLNRKDDVGIGAVSFVHSAWYSDTENVNMKDYTHKTSSYCGHRYWHSSSS